MSEQSSKVVNSPLTPNEKLLEKLIGSFSDQTFNELDNDLLDDEEENWEISFDEVDDHISEFQEDEFVREAFDKGMDLREYARNIEKELSIIEKDHEADYIKEAKGFTCDQILETMENMLSVFQKDLGNISTEIQTLQDKSFSMNIKLKNRTAVEKKLDNVLEGIAAEKIRDFLLNKIRSLRIPNTNVQILQQSVLLKYKELYQFVMDRYNDVAFEIMHTYINTMKWYFFNHFDRYNRTLQKLQNPVGDKSSMIGYDENLRKGGIFGSSKIALQDKTNMFVLGDRIDTLRTQDAGVILVHVAENKNQKYSSEALFRSFNLTLIDNASSEYLFIIEFFSKDDKPNVEGAKDIFSEIFDTTIKMGLNSTKQYVANTYDAIGTLLCIRLNTQFALELQRRRVPALEGYTNQTNMLLWPRFQAIMDMHIESVRKATNKMTVKDVHPHFMSKSFDDDNKSSLIFLINNYDLIITILGETGGKAVEADINHFKELLNVKISEFVEEELNPYFGSLVAIVKMLEQEKDGSTIGSEFFDKVSTDFASTWRQSLTSINTSVIQHFSNFKNGTTILHAVLGQLIIYYTRFCNALEERMKDGTVRIGHQPVGVQSVMVEIKKFRRWLEM
ncbi:6209_t:CDS:10 [Diversispora eburnea]|uniref:6209_t:CDS:1 n=1 Tax=Diversispora eburnea TaxID=1213867 RepID=A0A9N8UZC5_9GLOM|nr:6209_t:CDS:10 [Diversispora eburnea]